MPSHSEYCRLQVFLVSRQINERDHLLIKIISLIIYQQECIPVGCVPPASVAISVGGGGLSALGCLPGEWGCTPPVNRITVRQV